MGVGVWLSHRESDTAEIAFLDVGQGDATVITVGGTSALIDTGPESSGLLAALVRRRVTDLRYVILTHLDTDHVGGTSLVLDRYRSSKLAISTEFKDHPQIDLWLARWRRTKDQVVWIPAESQLKMGAATLRLVAPPRSEATSDNDASIAIRFVHGASTAVLTGDLGTAMERELAETGNWSAQVAKCGHHGSAGSTSSEWLSEVQPKFAVASCGRNNPFGHPHPDVLERLKSSGTKILRTDQDGTIRFRSTATGFELVP